MQVTKEQIAAWIQAADTSKPTHREAMGRMVYALYQRQTTDEQASESTNHNNGRGFNGTDAAWGSSVAVQFHVKGYVSPKQAQGLKRMLRKYAGQLAEVKNTAV